MEDTLIESVIKDASQFSDKVEVYRWSREPDFKSDYKEEWEKSVSQSINTFPQRFELLSDYRLVRDSEYIEWLKAFDINTYQLTLFGLEELTNHYTGRPNAFNEVIEATNIILDEGLIPRWQFFAYQDTIKELEAVLQLIDDLKLRERSIENGGEFKFFVHEGSCDGVAVNLYDKWITIDDLNLIPDEYNQCSTTTEKELLDSLVQADLKSIVVKEPVFYVDSALNVYPNDSTSKGFLLGNLNNCQFEDCINTYFRQTSKAQKLIVKIDISELKQVGFPTNKVFSKDDYLIYLINKYLELNPDFC